MAAEHPRRGGRPAKPVKVRRGSAGRRRVTIALAAPDGAVGATRGLGSWLSGAAPARARGEVSVAIVSDGRMKALNRAYRGKDYATDVLSFPVEGRQTADARRVTVERPPSRPEAASARPRRSSPHGSRRAEAGRGATADSFLGDIVIAAGVAERQADEAGHSLQTELRILALHGLLHLLGHDHESDAGEMTRVETRLRRKAGLREGLVERAGSRQAAVGSRTAGGESGLPSAGSRLPARSRR